MLVLLVGSPTVEDKAESRLRPLESRPAFSARTLELYGRFPMQFEPNRGQSDGQVKFLTRGKGYSLLLTSTEAALVTRPSAGPRAASQFVPASERMRPVKGKVSVLRMKLVGANPEPRIVGRQELPGKVNYYIGNDPGNWLDGIPTYAKVEYRSVYPGVDLAFYGNQGELEHDFIVAPFADPKIITLRFEGANRPRLDPSGDLLLEMSGATGLGELRLKKPTIYQETEGVRREIAGGYILKGFRVCESRPNSSGHDA